MGSGFRATGSVVALSRVGVLVRCAEPLEAGSLVRMGMELGHETLRPSATAKGSVPGVGTTFEFIQMTEGDRSLLRRLILRVEKERAY